VIKKSLYWFAFLVPKDKLLKYMSFIEIQIHRSVQIWKKSSNLELFLKPNRQRIRRSATLKATSLFQKETSKND
jgi:hypothetical protein